MSCEADPLSREPILVNGQPATISEEPLVDPQMRGSGLIVGSREI